MTAPDPTEFTTRRPFLTPRARRGAMEPATRLRQSPIPAILAVVRGGIRRMSAKIQPGFAQNWLGRLSCGSCLVPGHSGLVSSSVL